MSHKSARKSHNASLTEEKEKKTETPLKEMKKKIAANAEKEKQATDKTVTSPDKADKNTDKVTDKPQNEKTDKKSQNSDKVDKNAPTPDKTPKPDKIAEKKDKIVEKTDKNAEKSDKKTDKVADKKVDKPVEKKVEPEKKEEVKPDGKDKPEKAKQNGATNGNAAGPDTVSDPDSSEEDLLVIDDQDELFPELAYDETSDPDYEEGAPSRSFTRRSQVKATKTPETPRPASVKEDDSKEKVLKMNDSLTTDRKLRSADSPKPESKKAETKKTQDSPKKDTAIDLTEEETEKNKEVNEKNKDGTEASEEGAKKTSEEGAKKTSEEGAKKTSAGKNQLEMDIVIELEGFEEARERARARVSPFASRPHAQPHPVSVSVSAPARHDYTTSSMLANYTGNNTTMEMDITETSSILEEPSLDDSSYLRGLRSIKGRSSYKPLKELSLKHTLNRSTRSNVSTANNSLNESARPTGTVVGRKRKTDADLGAAGEEIEGGGEEAGEAREAGGDQLFAQTKRMRLFDRFSLPFRGFDSRGSTEIVGINTDLPLTAPVASSSTFDPETLKTSPSDPVAVPLPTPSQDRDSKRCLIM